MSEEQTTTRSELLSLTTQIVTAQLSNNPSSGTDVPGLIQAVFDTLTELSRDEAPAPALTPAVPIRRSVTDDHIVCLEDGKKLKMLKRHLMTAYGMTPAAVPGEVGAAARLSDGGAELCRETPGACQGDRAWSQAGARPGARTETKRGSRKGAAKPADRSLRLRRLSRTACPGPVTFDLLGERAQRRTSANSGAIARPAARADRAGSSRPRNVPAAAAPAQAPQRLPIRSNDGTPSPAAGYGCALCRPLCVGRSGGGDLAWHSSTEPTGRPPGRRDSFDLILGKGGADLIEGFDGADAIDGGSGDDEMDGGAGVDAIRGGDGNDRLLGRTGADLLDGGDGDDQIFGEEGSDLIYGGDGIDDIDGGDGSDLILRRQWPGRHKRRGWPRPDPWRCGQ